MSRRSPERDKGSESVEQAFLFRGVSGLVRRYEAGVGLKIGRSIESPLGNAVGEIVRIRVMIFNK